MIPHTEYSTRLADRRAVVAGHRAREGQVAGLRLLIALAFVVVAWLVFGAHALSAWWLAAPVVAFIALMVLHERLIRRRERAQRAVDFYERGLARLEDRWAGSGETGDRFRDDAHPYAGDLDVFGPGSLFELLCTARTHTGEATLARWLLAPASPAEVHLRQEAVEELRARLDLREEIAVLGEDVRRGVHAEPLSRWGEQPVLLDSPAARIAALALAVATFPLLAWLTVKFFQWMAGYGSLDLEPWPTVALVLVTAEAVFWFCHRRRVARAVQEVEQPAHDLALLSEILDRLEREEFRCARLKAIRQALETEGHPASRQIARLKRWVEILDSRDHVLVRLAGPPLLWTTQVAFAIEAWRKHAGPALRRWLDALGEFEALSALAGYAFEHPDDPFPDVADGGAQFEAAALGHPLIPVAQCVRNNVRLGANPQVLLVSGSNMSGKSTLLRTVGVNAVLAMAGAPVRAASLRLSPVAVGACIRVTDSLQTGASRFYAEIKRIRQLMDMAKGQPVLLFLMDELLHGTNSHDRRIGAEAIVRGFVERGAIGLVTTHDLALARIPAELEPRVANVHFDDRLEDGRMLFDYTLKPGVVTHSNAIALMRSVGLEV